MKNHIYKKIIGIIIMTCVFASGCGKTKFDNLQDQMPVREDEPEYKEKKAERIGVYVDVTPSMKGFLGMQADAYREVVEETRYMTCLDEINKIITAKYNEQQIKNYRIDTPLWQTDENVLDKARGAKYYGNSAYMDKEYIMIDLIEDDGAGYDSRCLANALKNCKGEDFSVIVTDFYENDSDAAGVIEALKENVQLESGIGKTVGIMGIKSEFAGTIYDISAFKKDVEYGIVNGEIAEEDIVYRQFFVIVISYPKAMQEFYGQLKESLNMTEEDLNYTVFYESNFYGLDYTNFEQCYSISKERGKRLWPEAGVVINNDSEMDVYDYSGQEEDVVLSYKVEGSSLINELEKGSMSMIKLPDISEKEMYEVQCSSEKQIYLWDQETKSFKADSGFGEVFRIEKLCYEPKENMVYIWLKVAGGNLPDIPVKLYGKVYYEGKGNLDYDWVKEWNLANGEEDYEKTRNLKEYVDGIIEKMPDRNNLLLDFSFYLHHQ